MLALAASVVDLLADSAAVQTYVDPLGVIDFSKYHIVVQLAATGTLMHLYAISVCPLLFGLLRLRAGQKGSAVASISNVIMLATVALYLVGPYAMV